jgi:hypothetical protein
MKLKTKILIITSIVIIISISAIAVYNTVSSNNAFEEIIELQLTDQLESFEGAIESSHEMSIMVPGTNKLTYSFNEYVSLKN